MLISYSGIIAHFYICVIYMFEVYSRKPRYRITEQVCLAYLRATQLGAIKNIRRNALRYFYLYV